VIAGIAGSFAPFVLSARCFFRAHVAPLFIQMVRVPLFGLVGLRNSIYISVDSLYVRAHGAEDFQAWYFLCMNRWVGPLYVWR
jgi:hypothetical protein